HILGMRVDATDYAGAISHIVALAKKREGGRVCVATVHMVMEAVDDPALREQINGAHLVTSDGMPLVWGLRAKGLAEAERVYGPTLTPRLCAEAERLGLRVGFFGGTPETLTALASRLEASSSEYGFGRLGHLAGSLVRLARHLPPDGHPSFEDASQLLGETLTVLPMVFENIAAEGSEDLPQLAGLQWRYDAEVAAAEELSQVLAGPPGPVDRALRAFREDDPEALGFFVPEAREHLQGMERSLGQLQTGPDDLDHLHTLFRQVHTLKGAAFTVGCEPVGQVTHWLEDLLVPVREGRIPLRRSALRAASAARDLLQEMVERLDGASGASLQHPYDHLLETFAALLRPESGAAETTRAAAGEEREAEPGIGVATAAEPSSPLDALWHEPPDRQEATAKAEPETAELAVQASVGAGGEIAAPATAAERPMEARDPEAGGRGDGATKKHSLRADFDRIDVLVEPAAELGDKSIVLETRGAEVEL
ncbi:MAG: Hpt domain-containing protein, partial [Holophagales bacterium]|nr:Hpt domain-containing protein [Holophagales bacterium]